MSGSKRLPNLFYKISDIVVCCQQGQITAAGLSRILTPFPFNRIMNANLLRCKVKKLISNKETYNKEFLNTSVVGAIWDTLNRLVIRTKRNQSYYTIIIAMMH